MFGRLVCQVRNARFVPIIWGGRQMQYLLHDEDLGHVVQGCLDGRVPAGVEPITVAREQGWELKEILAQIARALGRRVTFLPVPWHLAWLGLKGLELAGARPNLPESMPFLRFAEVAGLSVPALSIACQPVSIQQPTSKDGRDGNYWIFDNRAPLRGELPVQLARSRKNAGEARIALV
jgi:hypothetical protein